MVAVVTGLVAKSCLVTRQICPAEKNFFSLLSKLFLFFFFFFFLLYNIVLVLPYINMSPPQVYTAEKFWHTLISTTQLPCELIWADVRKRVQEFPGGPMVRTPSFHFCRLDSVLGGGAKIPKATRGRKQNIIHTETVCRSLKPWRVPSSHHVYAENFLYSRTFPKTGSSLKTMHHTPCFQLQLRIK